jgi:Fibronectin type III domain
VQTHDVRERDDRAKVHCSAVDCPEPFPHRLRALRCTSATLSWSAPTTNAGGTSLSDLAGYKVYSGVTSRTYGTPIDVGNRTTYTLTGLANGTQYYIAVKAYETSGNESGFSAEVPFPDRTLAANFTAIATSGPAHLMVTFTDSSRACMLAAVIILNLLNRLRGINKRPLAQSFGVETSDECTCGLGRELCTAGLFSIEPHDISTRELPRPYSGRFSAKLPVAISCKQI